VRGSARLLGAAALRVTLCEQVPVPSEYGVGAYQQLKSSHRSARWRAEQRGEEGSACRFDPHPVAVRVPLQDIELVVQGQDLDVFVPIAAGE
jgi:hypothetical protein